MVINSAQNMQNAGRYGLYYIQGRERGTIVISRSLEYSFNSKEPPQEIIVSNPSRFKEKGKDFYALEWVSRRVVPSRVNLSKGHPKPFFQNIR
jgi:hypothetical protein